VAGWKSAAPWLAGALAMLLAGRAQAEPDRSLFFQELDLAVAFPSGVTLAASYTPTFGFWERRLDVGLGARFTAFRGGSGYVFPNGNADQINAGASDTFTVHDPSSYALNLMFVLSVRIVAGLEVGVNIDVIGVGFGPSVLGTYQGATPGVSGPAAASPTTFNFLLLGKNDRGQLDSELFAAYWFEHWGVRAGISHMSTEYTLARPGDAGNTVFRAPATRFVASVGYRF